MRARCSPSQARPQHQTVGRSQEARLTGPSGCTRPGHQHTFQLEIPVLFASTLSALTGALLFISSLPEDAWVTDVAWNLISASLPHSLSICLEASPWR